jgi:hypothetical protein
MQRSRRLQRQLFPVFEKEQETDKKLLIKI